MKTRKIAIATGGGLVAILILFYLTLEAAPDGPPTGVEHNVEGASAECLKAVTVQLPNAHLRFSPSATYLGDRRYRLEGTVDGISGEETVRRKYECLVRYSGSGLYQTDSVTVWQSH